MANSVQTMRNLTKKLVGGTMTMQELVRQAGDDKKKYNEVYVLNTSDFNGLRKKGDVILTVTTGPNQDPVNVIVPHTWIPISLTASVTLTNILESTNIRKAVQNGTITLIQADIAEEILRSQMGREEQQSLAMKGAHIDEEALKGKGAAAGSPEIQKLLAEKQKTLAKGNDSPDEGINPQLVSIVNREDIETKEILAAIRAIQNDLTPKDIHYIMSHVNGKKHEAVIAYARELLEEFEAEEGDKE